MPSWRSRWTSTCHCERLRPSARARWSKRLRKRRAMSWRRKPKLRSGSYVMPAMMISRHSLSKLINTSATRSVHLGDAALGRADPLEEPVDLISQRLALRAEPGRRGQHGCSETASLVGALADARDVGRDLPGTVGSFVRVARDLARRRALLFRS